MRNQQLFEAPFVSEVGTNRCSKCTKAGVGRGICKRCRGKISPFNSNLGSKPGYAAQWLFEAPPSPGMVYTNEFENELEQVNEYEQLETNLESWNESTSAYLSENESPFPDESYRWPKQSIFKVPPAETIKSGSYQTALCPAFDDFLELRNLVRDFRSQLGTRPQKPTKVRDVKAVLAGSSKERRLTPQESKRWDKAIEAWEKNIRAWGKRIELLSLKMIKQLKDHKSYVGQGCTKTFFRDLAKKVNSLRGSWLRSGAVLGVRRAIDKRLIDLRDAATRAAQ